MTTLVIRDLERNESLDSKALSETSGGRRCRPRRPRRPRPGRRNGYYGFIPLGGFRR